MKSLKKRIAAILSVAAAFCFAVGLLLFAGSFKSYAETSDTLTMERGAYVRADDSATGLRFVASMSKSAYESISESVTEAGMFIMPEDYLTKHGELTVENLFGDTAVYTTVKEEGKTRIIGITYGGMAFAEGENRYEIRGTVSDIFETNYTRNFVARAYLKMNDGSVIMAEYSDGNYVNNVRNVANVAKLALAANVSYSGKQLAALADYTDFAEKITGEKYLSLFEPQTGSSTGSVSWDSEEKAYKFSFNAMEGNERAFVINADFFHKIAAKTGATALSFKVKAGNENINNLLFSYAPWDGTAVSYPAVNNTDYTEITIDFKSIPKDAEGNFKSPFILALENSHVSNCLYIKDVTVIKPYNIAKIYDADKLAVEGAKVNLGDLRFTLSDNYPAGATGSVLKSGVTWKSGWEGSSFKFDSPVPAANYKAVALRVFVENSSLDKVNAVMFKYGDTNSSNEIYNQDIPTNRWYNLMVDASSLANTEGNIEGIALSIATETVPTVYVDSVVLMCEPAAKNYLVENGTTEYKVLLSEGATENERSAAEEFVNLFKKATGIDIATASSVSDGAKYISIGNTELLEASGISLTLDELGKSGYKILTSGDSILVCGATDKGTLYGVYGLLAELFDFDAYFKDTYTINENVTTMELPEINLSSVPDIERRVVGNGGVNYGYGGDRTTQNRLRFENFGDDFILIDGKMAHNSISYVTGKTGDTENWYYKSGRIFGSVDRTKQLCYSARGNSTDYNNMVNAAFETLKAALIAEPDKSIVTFSCEDNYSNCRCSACQSSDNDGYNETDRVIKFVNNVYNKVLEWFAGEGASYKRDLDMVVYAYLTTASAPKQIKPVSGVKVLYAPIGFDFTSEITASVNASIYEEAQKWNEMTDEMYLWIYSANFYYYLAPYLNVDSMQSYYRFAKSAGVKWIFDQGQHDNAFATGFSNLKTYLASKLAWNTEADVAALTDKFFNAYFGPASSAMRTFYDGYNAAYKSASGLHINTSCQVMPSSAYWSKNDLIGWINNCGTALNAIASLESSDAEAYALYHKHIAGERVSAVYLLIELYRNELSDSEKTAYLDMFKQDVLEAGISFPRESGAQTFDALYASWGTSPAEAVTVDLASPVASASVSGAVVSVTIKGETVSDENYTLSNGVLTLKPEYIGKLGEGNHIFEVTLESGAFSWYVTVTDKLAPQYEVITESSYEAGEIVLPAATNKAGTYQRLTPVYYLDGEEKDECATVNLGEGTYTLTVKFMRNGKLVEGGDISVNLVVVAKKVYVIGDVIDMTVENVTAGEAGLGGLWGMSHEFITEGGTGYITGGNGGEVKFSQSAENAGGKIILNDPITVTESMNFVKIRMYIATSSDSITVRFNRSDRTTHYEAPIDTQVATNAWINVCLKVSDLVVDGNFCGVQFGYIGCNVSAIYLDGISLVENKYAVGETIDMDEVTVSAVNNFGLLSFSSMNIVSSADISGYNGKLAEIHNNGATLYPYAANVALDNAITVKEGMNFIKVRVFISCSSEFTMNMRFYRSDRTNHQVEDGVWFDATTNIAANVWTNVYLSVSDFAVNGKIEGFKFGCFTDQANAKVYIDDITVLEEKFGLGDIIDMEEMNASTDINLSGISSMWSRGFEEASAAPDGASGKVFKANGGGQSHGFMIALKEGISLKSGMNYIAVRMYISDSTLTSVNLRFYKTSRTNHEEGVDGDVVVATNQWTTVYLEASKFVVDGKITGFKCANFQAGSSDAVFYVDNISLTKLSDADIDLNGTKIGYVGSGNYWHNGETVTGSEIVLDGGAQWSNANLIFATPFTVTNETKIVLKIRMSKALDNDYLAFFNGKGEHKASYTDASTSAAPVNDYAEVTLNVSDFAEDGQIKSISIGVWGNVTGTLTLYIASVSVL